MKALYNRRLCSVVDIGGDITLNDAGRQFVVPFSHAGLVVDPTDAQVADADNLSELYGTDEGATNDVRAMLRGEISGEDSETRKRCRATGIT